MYQHFSLHEYFYHHLFKILFYSDFMSYLCWCFIDVYGLNYSLSFSLVSNMNVLFWVTVDAAVHRWDFMAENWWSIDWLVSINHAEHPPSTTQMEPTCYRISENVSFPVVSYNSCIKEVNRKSWEENKFYIVRFRGRFNTRKNFLILVRLMTIFLFTWKCCCANIP